MSFLKIMLDRIKSAHPAVKYSFMAGAATMLGFYITAVFAFLIAPHVDFVKAMDIHRGCLEAAPASLAAGVVGGLIGDLLLGRNGKDGGGGDK